MMSNQRASYPIRVEPLEGDDRTIRFVASSGGVARDGGIVEPQGWNLDNYRRNAVVLWAHDSNGLPIGKAIRLEKTDEALLIDVAFAGEEQAHPLAETVYRLYRAGFLKSVSVGFRVTDEREPTDEERERGAKWVATSAELLELSCVPVPADVNAVAISRAVSDGIVTESDARIIRTQWGAIEDWKRIADVMEHEMHERGVVETDIDYRLIVRDGAQFREGTFEQVEYPVENGTLPITATIGTMEDERTVIQALQFPKDQGWTAEAADDWVANNQQAILDWQKAEDPAPEDDEEEVTPLEPAPQEMPEETASSGRAPDMALDALKEIKAKVDALLMELEGDGEDEDPEEPAPEDTAEVVELADDCVGQKIKKLLSEGYPQDQAEAIAVSMCEEGREEHSTFADELRAAIREEIKIALAEGSKEPKPKHKSDGVRRSAGAPTESLYSKLLDRINDIYG